MINLFHRQTSSKDLIILWADTLVINSNYKGDVDTSSFNLDWIRSDDPQREQQFLDWKNDEARKVRKMVIKSFVNDDFNFVCKELSNYRDTVKNHLLDEGYIHDPDSTQRFWELTDRGKLMKELGGHKKYKKYRRTEITALNNQRKINAWLIAATILAAIMPFVIAYFPPPKIVVNVPQEKHQIDVKNDTVKATNLLKKEK